MDKIKQIIPEGCTRARIRATSRTARKADSEGTLAQTLGDESRGMVVVDFQGHPQTYDSLKIFSDVVAKEVNVLKVDVPRESGRGWKRTAAEISQGDMGEGWREGISEGARYVIEETWGRCDALHLRGPVRTLEDMPKPP